MIVPRVLLFILLELFVQASQAFKALDPEEAWYVYERCHEDHLPSGPNRETYLKTWKFWKLEPNDAVTHCYVKCTLAGLQMYDEKTKTFKPETVPVQHEAYKAFTEVESSKVNELEQALSSLNAGSGSCAEVFNAYLPVHNKYVGVSRKIYHGTVDSVAKIYAAKPEIKKQEESFVAYCAKKALGANGKEGYKKLRDYELADSAEFRNAMDCVFRGFRYIDDSGLKIDEVVRDFNLINKSDLEPEVRSVLASCTGTQAYDYYSCLLNSSVKEDFRNAFYFHELRSANYGYLAMGNVYEGPEKVKEELKKLSY
uniref:Long form D7 salivary protein n=1 Tax=Anopheles melas TaxID=34690 RepID=A0A1Y9INE9_9DIPT